MGLPYRLAAICACTRSSASARSRSSLSGVSGDAEKRPAHLPVHLHDQLDAVFYERRESASGHGNLRQRPTVADGLPELGS
jgi:hypothetical protein